ncbi:MAG TPA: NAD(P)/FAD-dependent oxidoreductase [Polyangiaceae bacterium]|jgi:thioredoxin reductase|nr:NAD(P)/FAD-dependent oxidoreductase [Polyangiaceae bacterium]
MHDVIIVGGSYAGLAAAMQLGRARRDVLVIDGGKRRNETVAHAHGLLGFDGEAPAAIAARGREQVRKYPTIAFTDGEVVEARREGDGFVVHTKDASFGTRKLILATGVRDELPEIPGLRERWGQTAFSCPYCDGYERKMGKLGVVASADIAPHYAVIVSQWGSETTLFADVDAPAGIRVERDPIAAVGDAAAGIEVVTRGGKRYELAGLFVGTHVRLPGDFASTLGLELETFPNGSFYKTDPRTKETSAPGVYAAGDASTPMHALSFAIADGARAGIGAHASLVMSAMPKH